MAMWASNDVSEFGRFGAVAIKKSKIQSLTLLIKVKNVYDVAENW